MASIINASTAGAGGLVQTADSSGVLQLQAAGANAITANSTTITISNTVLNDSGRPILRQSGSILQVVQTVTTANITTTNSTAYQTTGLVANITLSSTSSRVLISVTGGTAYNGPNNMGLNNKLYRSIGGGAYSNLTSQATDWGVYSQLGGTTVMPHSFTYLDSPANTSTISYQPYFRVDPNGAAGTASFNGPYFGQPAGTVTITLMEISG